jgi:DNA-binding NtrC family response regulator
MPKVLVIDDELSIRESFSLILEDDYDVKLASSGEAALKILNESPADIIFLDIRMPGMNGIETLRKIKEQDPTAEVIMVTAINDVQKASEAVRLGAREYVVKPFEVDQILALTKKMLTKKNILNQETKVQIALIASEYKLIGQSDRIKEIEKSIRSLKGHEKILITGETGTEKETLAAIIHYGSPNREKSFHSISLTESIYQLPAPALEGSGTLFINNIEYLTKEMLSQINPALRLIAGSQDDVSKINRDVFEAFSNVILTLPPLRKRVIDIPLLINYYLEKFNRQYHKHTAFDPQIMEAFANYPWPNNTLELEITIERMVLSSKKLITLLDLPFSILVNTSGKSLNSLVADFQDEYSAFVFEKSGKDSKKASSILGVTPNRFAVGD